MNDTPRWVTKAEAAEHMRCTTRTVENYLKAGILTGYRLQRKVLLDLAEINTYIESRKDSESPTDWLRQ